MPTLSLIRHGESQWNKDNRFTGWVDVELSKEGRNQARNAGKLLINNRIKFEVIYTSYLKRAIQTLWEIQTITDKMWMSVDTDWRLNERHYGGLQGKDKDETRREYGSNQVKIWRRSYATPPPKPEREEIFTDDRYLNVTVPPGESLKDTLNRVMPCWEEKIKPQLENGKNVLIVAHGNSLRSLAKHLDQMDDENIMNFEIPTGVPLVYELNSKMSVIKRRFLTKE